MSEEQNKPEPTKNPDELTEQDLDQVAAGAYDSYLYFDPPPPKPKTK